MSRPVENSSRTAAEISAFLAGRGSYLFHGWQPGIVSVAELCTFLGIVAPTEPAPLSAAQLAALEAEFPDIFKPASVSGLGEGEPQ